MQNCVNFLITIIASFWSFPPFDMDCLRTRAVLFTHGRNKTQRFVLLLTFAVCLIFFWFLDLCVSSSSLSFNLNFWGNTFGNVLYISVLQQIFISIPVLPHLIKAHFKNLYFKFYFPTFCLPVAFCHVCS